MIAILLAVQPMVEGPAAGIARAVPPTRFSCELAAADGGKFSVAGKTPRFAKGWDPNRAEYVELQSTHAEAFRGKVGIDPGDAGEWFRDFQVASGYSGVTQYTLQLKLRKEGASVAYVTRYRSTAEQVPFEYYAAGLCTADFAPDAGGEKGQP